MKLYKFRFIMFIAFVFGLSWLLASNPVSFALLFCVGLFVLITISPLFSR